MVSGVTTLFFRFDLTKVLTTLARPVDRAFQFQRTADIHPEWQQFFTPQPAMAALPPVDPCLPVNGLTHP
jgi:hypothetical protein